MGLMKSRIAADKHIVVVGAGYAGVNLGVELLGRKANFTIIDAREAIHHNIATGRALVEPGMLTRSFVPYRRTFGDHFKLGRVSNIDAERKQVFLQSGETIPYDALVIATGSFGDFPVKLKDQKVDEALIEYKNLHQQVKAAQRIVVVGGGGAGVEIASEIKTDYPSKHVSLIHSRQVLVSDATTAEFQASLKDILERLGIQLILGQRVSNMNELSNQTAPVVIRIDNGTNIEADLLLKCTGLRVNTGAYNQGLVSAMNDKGQLKVNEHLRIHGYSDIFAIGDCCDTKDFKFARSALRHSVVVAENLSRMFTGQPLKPYSPGNSQYYGIALALGRANGISQTKSGGTKSGPSVVREKSRDVLTTRLWRIMGQSIPTLD